MPDCGNLIFSMRTSFQPNRGTPQLGLVSSLTAPYTLSLRSSWTLKKVSQIANMTLVSLRPFRLCQKHTTFLQLGWTLNITIQQLIALVYFFLHTYSLHCHYQAIMLTFWYFNRIVYILLWLSSNLKSIVKRIFFFHG